MKVNECMTRDVKIVSPDETIQQAGELMASIDVGILPVGEKDRLVGMITDRDIAVRGVARGKGPDAKIRDVMTTDVKYCFEDQDVGEVTRNMGEIQVRRLPVLNRDKRLIGIIALGDVAVDRDGNGTEQALRKISQPGGLHSQTG
jgi:CBS domain-containing protein